MKRKLKKSDKITIALVLLSLTLAGVLMTLNTGGVGPVNNLRLAKTQETPEMFISIEQTSAGIRNLKLNTNTIVIVPIHQDVDEIDTGAGVRGRANLYINGEKAFALTELTTELPPLNPGEYDISVILVDEYGDQVLSSAGEPMIASTMLSVN